MTNIEIVQHLKDLSGLLENEKKANTQRLTSKVYYAVRKNINTFTKFYIPYEETLFALQKKYPGEEGKVDEDNADYQKELKDLILVENKDIVVHKISLEDMVACKDLTYEEMDALFFMVKE